MFDDILGKEKEKKDTPETNTKVDPILKGLIADTSGASGSPGISGSPGTSGTVEKKAKAISIFDLLKPIQPSSNIRRDILRTFYQHLENRNAMDKEKEKKEEFM